MADVEYTQDVTRQGARAKPSDGGVGMIANLAGAGISLALLIGIGIWGYKLMVRDVSGIPVVRAVDGPMRIQPENPGGRPADHQGLAVNAVAAQGSAAAPADRLVLAPQPVELVEEDAPQSQITRPAVRPEPASDTQREAEIAATDSQARKIDALVAEITQGVEPLERLSSAEERSEPAADPIVAPEPLVLDGAASSPQPVSAATIPVPQPAVARDVPGVVRSLRPQKRPAGGPPLVTATPATAEVDALDIDPAEVPVGTRVVQLGAFESAEIAQREWDRLAAQFADYMTDKRRIVQQAQSGGRTFFRLRALGFDDLSDARRFCSVLVAEGADCIPVVTR